VVPTTLLSRQHTARFRNALPACRSALLNCSRFTSAKDAKDIKARLTSGDVDIVIGTHALLAKGISFRNLGS